MLSERAIEVWSTEEGEFQATAEELRWRLKGLGAIWRVAERKGRGRGTVKDSGRRRRDAIMKATVTGSTGGRELGCDGEAKRKRMMNLMKLLEI